MSIDLEQSVHKYDECYGGSEWYERISARHHHGAFDSKCTRTLHTDHHNDLARILNAVRRTAEEADSVALWQRVAEWIRVVPITYLKTFGCHHPYKLLHFENWEGYQTDAMDCCKNCCDGCCDCSLTEEVIHWARLGYASLREAARRTQDPRYWAYLELFTGFMQEVLDAFFPDRREYHEQWGVVREEVVAQLQNAG
jgi:hypothetical protein